MRISNASLRLSFLLVVAFIVGCSGCASESGSYTKDSSPPEEGMVWNAEHGHFHRVAAPTGALRGHQTDRLDQKLDDAESLVEQ